MIIELRETQVKLIAPNYLYSQQKARLMRILSLLLFLVVLGCAPSAYRKTNREYRKQAKEYGKILAEYPLKDSVTGPSFIGTVNFNMRKPNFVVIHHTA